MTGDLAADLSLPFPTIFLARPAKRDGAFGLVGGGITIPYHVSILGQTRGQNTITNHYHRDEDNSQSNSASMTQWQGGQGGPQL